MSRISPGTFLLAIVAVAAGLLGAYIVKQNLEQKPVAEAEPPATESMVVPLSSTSLKAGREITMGDIAIYRLTSEQIKAQGIDGPFMSNAQQIIGRVLKEDLTEGQPFDTSLFYPEGMGPGVADMLEPGKRAITVPVELDSAVAGFATPGTWVDVLFRSKSTGESEVPEVAVTLLERVKVLAVNETTFEGSRSQGRDRTENARVTLEVAPDDATALRVVDGRGTLALALRHPDDELSFARLNPMSLSELLNIPPPQRHKMEVFRGNRVSRVDFEAQRDATTIVTRVAEQEEPETEEPREPLKPTSTSKTNSGTPSGGGQ